MPRHGRRPAAQDPLNVELTTAAGGRVTGPIKEVWAIAPATLKGAIFYNTYGSPQVAQNGAIMRLFPGSSSRKHFRSSPASRRSARA